MSQCLGNSDRISFCPAALGWTPSNPSRALMQIWIGSPDCRVVTYAMATRFCPRFMSTSILVVLGSEHSDPGDHSCLNDCFGSMGKILSNCPLPVQRQKCPFAMNDCPLWNWSGKETVSKERRSNLNHAWALSLSNCRRFETGMWTPKSVSEAGSSCWPPSSTVY